MRRNTESIGNLFPISKQSVLNTQEAFLQTENPAEELRKEVRILEASDSQFHTLLQQLGTQYQGTIPKVQFYIGVGLGYRTFREEAHLRELDLPLVTPDIFITSIQDIMDIENNMVRLEKLQQKDQEDPYEYKGLVKEFIRNMRSKEKFIRQNEENYKSHLQMFRGKESILIRSMLTLIYFNYRTAYETDRVRQMFA